mgnify:CR=1 FL=1
MEETTNKNWSKGGDFTRKEQKTQNIRAKMLSFLKSLVYLFYYHPVYVLSKSYGFNTKSTISEYQKPI